MFYTVAFTLDDAILIDRFALSAALLYLLDSLYMGYAVEWLTLSA